MLHLISQHEISKFLAMGLCSSSSRGDCARDAMGRVSKVLCHNLCFITYGP